VIPVTRGRIAILAGLLALVAVVGAGAWYWWTWPARQVTAVRAALAAGQNARAETLLAPLLSARPEDPQVHLLHAQALRRLERFGEAERALEHAARNGLPRGDGEREMALLLSAQDWPPQVEGLFNKVAKDHPDDVEVVGALAAGYARRGRWKEALGFYSALVRLEPGQIENVFQRGLANMNERLFAEAIDDFRRVVKARPSHFLARLYLSHSLLSEARTAEAEVELQVCRQLRPDRVEPLVGLVNCAAEKGDLKTAEDWLSQAVALDRASPLVLHEVVNLHLLRGRFGPAREVLETMLRTVPNDKQVHLKLAQIFQREGDRAKAARHQQRYQELDQKEEALSRGMR
jgi:tetratricopeptide (TPR) repeat protein